MVFIASLAVIIGVASALIAEALLLLIGLFTNVAYYGRLSTAFVSPAGNTLGYYAIAVPVIGGLIVGTMARFGSERIRGHGIPEAIESILIDKSKMQPRIALLKPVATAVSIGTGGPFGAEGPIIMTGGSVGSIFAQFLSLSSAERKTLLVAGATGGMAATFNSPVAAVLLAVELLLFEWKPRSLIPVALASITAALVRGIIIGSSPIFPIAPTPVPDAIIILCAVLVGLVAGGASTILTRAVYASEDAFKRLPIHWMWWPLIGGVGIGLGGLISPRALGVGYDTIDALLLGNMVVGTIIILVIVKASIWAFSLGSGTSGGVLAPLLMIGACLGSLEAHFLPAGTGSLWVMVSMGAMLGGVMRVPFTGTIFVLELTHDVNGLLPVLVATVVAEGFTVLSMKRSILTEKVARRGVHVAREYSVDPLEMIPVGSVMRDDVRTVRGDVPVEEVGGGGGGRSVHGAPSTKNKDDKEEGDGRGEEGQQEEQEGDRGSSWYAVVDAAGHLWGLVTRRELESSNKGTLMRDVVIDRDPIVAFPDEPTRVAADRFASFGKQYLPVVEPLNPGHVVGVISREDIFQARALWLKQEKIQEKFLGVPGLSARRSLSELEAMLKRAREMRGRRNGGSDSSSSRRRKKKKEKKGNAWEEGSASSGG
jgi:CIC family chloride channel protein